MKKKKNKIVLNEQTETTPSIESNDLFELEDLKGDDLLGALKTESSKKTRRISDLDTFKFEGDYHRFETKKEFVFAAFYTGQKIKEESRTKALWVLGVNSLYLNSHWDLDALINVLSMDNEWHCEPPLPEEKIKSLAEEVYDIKLNGELENKIVKTKRRFIFKKGMTMEEKRQIIGKNTGPLVANAKKEESVSKIEKAIKDWEKEQGKITQQKISEQSGLSVKTVKRHWSAFKELVKEKNNTFNKKEINEDTRFFNGPHTGSTASEVVKVDPQYIKDLEIKGRELSQPLKEIIEGGSEEVEQDFSFSALGNPVTKRTAKESIEMFGKENLMTISFETWEKLPSA